jgi:hypothetical protein
LLVKISKTNIHISYLSSLNIFLMKNKGIIVIASLLAVIVCLIITVLLFYPVEPNSLIIISFIIGVITGVCIAALIRNMTNIIKAKRPSKEK